MLCIPTIELLKEKPIENHGNGGIEKTKRMTLPRNGKEKKGVCKTQSLFDLALKVFYINRDQQYPAAAKQLQNNPMLDDKRVIFAQRNTKRPRVSLTVLSHCLTVL